MRLIGAALKFGMKLYAYKKWMLRQLYGFNQPAVWRSSAYGQSRFLQLPAIFIIKLITVAVTLMDLF